LSASSTVFDNSSTKIATRHVVGQSSLVGLAGNSRLQVFQGFLQPLSNRLVDGLQFDFSIYPNPSRGLVYLNFPNKISGRIEIQARNLEGKVLVSTSVSEHESVLELASLASGVYFVKALQDNGKSSVHKIILE